MQILRSSHPVRYRYLHSAPQTQLSHQLIDSLVCVQSRRLCGLTVLFFMTVLFCTRAGGDEIKNNSLKFQFCKNNRVMIVTFTVLQTFITVFFV